MWCGGVMELYEIHRKYVLMYLSYQLKTGNSLYEIHRKYVLMYLNYQLELILKIMTARG